MKRELIAKLAEEFNNYSELVALNYEQIKEGKCDDGTLQWNRGSLNKIEEHLELLANTFGVKLYFRYGKHSFGFDDWKRELEYRTVMVDYLELAD